MKFLSRKSKLGMNEVALFEYFNARLEESTKCHNKRCTCLAILVDASARASIAKYCLVEGGFAWAACPSPQPIPTKKKTDKSKRRQVGLGGKVLRDKKISSIFV